jgi:hypothetical protein
MIIMPEVSEMVGMIIMTEVSQMIGKAIISLVSPMVVELFHISGHLNGRDDHHTTGLSNGQNDYHTSGLSNILCTIHRSSPNSQTYLFNNESLVHFRRTGEVFLLTQTQIWKVSKLLTARTYVFFIYEYPTTGTGL